MRAQVDKSVRSIWSRIRPRHDHLVIACFTRSGSTYMRKALSEITGFRGRNACEAYDDNEQELCAYKLRRLRQRSVIQQHFRATKYNVGLLKQYGIRPIVNYRNIFDCIVSLHDYYRNKDFRGANGHIHPEYWNLGFDERIDLLIKIQLPWYFNFFMSWRDAAKEIETFTMTYERFFADRIGALRQMLDFYGLSAPASRIEEALERLKTADTLLNKGRSGRGEEMLKDRHKAAVYEMAQSWRIDLDEMSLMGLTESGRVKARVPVTL